MEPPIEHKSSAAYWSVYFIPFRTCSLLLFGPVLLSTAIPCCPLLSRCPLLSLAFHCYPVFSIALSCSPLLSCVLCCYPVLSHVFSCYHLFSIAAGVGISSNATVPNGVVVTTQRALENVVKKEDLAGMLDKFTQQLVSILVAKNFAPSFPVSNNNSYSRRLCCHFCGSEMHLLPMCDKVDKTIQEGKCTPDPRERVVYTPPASPTMSSSPVHTPRPPPTPCSPPIHPGLTQLGPKRAVSPPASFNWAEEAEPLFISLPTASSTLLRDLSGLKTDCPRPFETLRRCTRRRRARPHLFSLSQQFLHPNPLFYVRPLHSQPFITQRHPSS